MNNGHNDHPPAHKTTFQASSHCRGCFLTDPALAAPAQEVLLGTWHPQTPFRQQRCATESLPTTAHLCTVRARMQSSSKPPALVQTGTKGGSEAALRTRCQQQIRSLQGTEAGGGGAAFGRNQGGRIPLNQADGAPRRPSQVSIPSFLSSPRPPPTPTALPRQQLGKGQAPRKPLIPF